jgi:hypothetical protein
LLKWVSLVVVCGIWYPLAAQLLVNTVQLSQVPSCIFGYLLLAFVVVLVFMFLKWLLASRLGDKILFGGGEYYLGMLSGMIRFACMLLAVLALLNAPVYTAQDIKKHEAYVKRGSAADCIAAISPATRERIRAASDIVDVIGSYLPLKKAGRELHRALPVSQGKDAQLQRQSAQADFPLLRLPQGRRRVHLRQGIRKHRLHGRRAPAGRTRENSAGIRPNTPANSNRAISRTSCSRSTSKSRSAGRTACSTKPPARPRAIISPNAACRRRR